MLKIEGHHIHMGNLMFGLENGSVIDLKLGRITYDIDASLEKKSKEMQKADIST